MHEGHKHSKTDKVVFLAVLVVMIKPETLDHKIPQIPRTD